MYQKLVADDLFISRKNVTNLISSPDFQSKLPKMKRYNIVSLACICLKIQRHKPVHCQDINACWQEWVAGGSQTEMQAILQVRMEVKITVVKRPFPCKIILQIIIYHFSSLHSFLRKKWVSTHEIVCYGVRHEFEFFFFF